MFPMHEIPFDFQRLTPFGFERLCEKANLEPPVIFFRGGAFVVFWVLIHYFIRGAGEFFARKLGVRMIVRAVDLILGTVDKIVVAVMLRRHSGAPYRADDPSMYSGIQGQNRRWAFGFLAETGKCI